MITLFGKYFRSLSILGPFKGEREARYVFTMES